MPTNRASQSGLPESVLSLPVLSLASSVADALRSGNVLLQAEPGAGKSTGLPLALLLDSAIAGRIVLLEPRRIAAASVAERLAHHLGETVGQRIGLRMRGETRVSGKTRLEVVTEGVLTRLLQDDAELQGVDLVIFDEYHERSLHADLGLALCLEVQRAYRDDLRLLLMSATLQSDDISRHLPGIRQFHCSVRQHPVNIVWSGESGDPLPQQVARVVREALSSEVGDILVFLPGVGEIRKTGALLQPWIDRNVQLHHLHSGVDRQARNRAIAPAGADCRRIILATSIAETSVTIDGVSVVIDSGVERRSRVDTRTGAQRLETVMASQASAIQRAGRAGRTAAGTCFRLWNESGHARRPAHWQPEIERVDLSALLMELGAWGASTGDNVPWLTPPPAAHLARAEALLVRLGLWSNGQLTSQGRVVARLPVPPGIGCMLTWASRHGVAELACKLAVVVEERQQGPVSVDLESVVTGSLPTPLQRLAEKLLCRLGAQPVDHDHALGQAPTPAVLLAQAFPDWVCQRRSGKPGRFRLACGAGAIVNEDEPLSHCQWLAVAELGGSDSEPRIFKAIQLDIDELQLWTPQLFAEQEEVSWDERQGRVVAERRTLFGELIVKAQPLSNVSGDDRARAMLTGIRANGVKSLPWTDECREWQARVSRMAELKLPAESGHWPAVDDQSLFVSLEEWLLPWLSGVDSMKALQKVDLQATLAAMLTYSQQKLLDDWLPRRYVVPSGSSIRLSYCGSGNPVLSVRLQEMLGCRENPVVARGQVPLTVELLSPARRPVQVTEDLANFWTGSYPAVKKDMAGRYPKHVWPDDPLNTQATSHAKRRR